jgi:adenylylsulfate kinase
MSNIHPHTYHISSEDRSKLFGHQAAVIWFTGLSGSGKTTIADLVEKTLYQQAIHTFSLDGDNIRKGINNDLGFSEEDRTENIRRIAEIAKLMSEAGLIVLSAFVSPFEKDRNKVRDLVGTEKYIEVFVNTPIEECEKRDVKGLYAKARKGEIKDFTGISSPYEAPQNPDIEINTTNITPETAAEMIVQLLKKRKFIS